MHSFDDKDMIKSHEKYGNPPLKIRYPSFDPPTPAEVQPLLFGEENEVDNAGTTEVRAGEESIPGVQGHDGAPADGSAQRSTEAETDQGQAGPEA